MYEDLSFVPVKRVVHWGQPEGVVATVSGTPTWLKLLAAIGLIGVTAAVLAGSARR
jgi:hypothetical protein